MAITMGALFQTLEQLQERIGEITTWDGNYSIENGELADENATDVACAYAFHLRQMVEFLEYVQREDATGESEEMKMISFKVAHSAAGITAAISQFDNPTDEDEDEFDEEESDESAEA